MLTFIFTGLGSVCLMVFVLVRDKNATPMAAVVKTFVSLFFIATALAALSENPISSGRHESLTPALLIVMGLVLGLVGDIMLDLKIVYQQKSADSDTYTWSGMAMFGMGHILFIIAVTMLYGFSLPAAGVGMILNTAIFIVSQRVMKMDFGKWFVPSLLYGFLLCIFMCIVMAAYFNTPHSGSGLGCLLTGSVLFLLSDLILSMTYFQGKDTKAMIAVNHMLYYAAQYSIAISLKYPG